MSTIKILSIFVITCIVHVFGARLTLEQRNSVYDSCIDYYTNIDEKDFDDQDQNTSIIIQIACLWEKDGYMYRNGTLVDEARFKEAFSSGKDIILIKYNKCKGGKDSAEVVSCIDDVQL